MLKTFGKTTVAAAALIASLALAAPASAATVSSSSVSKDTIVTGPSVTLTNGMSYVFNLTWTGITSAFGIFGATLENGSGVAYNVTSLFAPASAGSTSTTFTVDAAHAGSYTLMLHGYGSFSSYTASGVSSTVVASVPGPVAGAGLSALLGLVGFGFYRRRYAA